MSSISLGVGAGLAGDEPPPIAVLNVASPAEELEPLTDDPAEVREAATSVRAHPGRIGNTDKAVAVGFRIGLPEGSPPLSLWNVSVGRQHFPHCVEVRPTAHPDELETPGLDTP